MKHLTPSVVKNVIEPGDAGKAIDIYESIRKKAHEELLRYQAEANGRR